MGSVYCEAPDAVLLIDPQAPPPGLSGADRFWQALDRDISRLARPVAVLLCNPWHVRSTGAVLERYGAVPGITAWLHAGVPDAPDVPGQRTFHDGDPLPGGVRSHSLVAPGAVESLFYLPAHRTLVAGDTLVGAGEGRLCVCPESWYGDTVAQRAWYARHFRATLRPLLDLPIDTVLTGHGPPVLSGGGSALARALESPAWVEG